jgi:DNA-binding CsgD family transcriptional regulator
MTYYCVDIPVTTGRGMYSHCAYSDRLAVHCLSRQRLGPSLFQGAQDQNAKSQNETGAEPAEIAVAIPLRKHSEEIAGFEITIGEKAEAELQKDQLQRDFRVLANYFHSHVLRMNGHDSDRSMLMSAKELDCLKWTAAGKTAWEASVILGISERTVRFHLNAAREKLNCATTTQAVAKAIVNQLIDP